MSSFGLWCISGSSGCIGCVGVSGLYGTFCDFGNCTVGSSFSEKASWSIGKIWGNVGVCRDTLEIPGERGLQSSLGSPVPGISKVFLYTSELTLARRAETRLFDMRIPPHIERGGLRLPLESIYTYIHAHTSSWYFPGPHIIADTQGPHKAYRRAQMQCHGISAAIPPGHPGVDAFYIDAIRHKPR